MNLSGNRLQAFFLLAYSYGFDKIEGDKNITM
jgi:hypothetical protein